ncbi:hypothetical protein PX52LOC_08137 [Limnoglobus roseus]|uniref:Uncharacterized protein n=2 Tax=Limnoglobus roseus TaxID=2598579 RepID=A0A5C1AW35_9BACT|nr:hypothetical protein PX52LOC_08137 [Limnoglobus roseus]
MNRCLAACLTFCVAMSAARAADPVSQTFEGSVQTLAKVLEKQGIPADKDVTGVALVTKDGTVYTIAKEKVSRLLFVDPVFENRTVRLTAKILPGSQILKVEKVQTVKAGKVYDVDYWCENCQLAWSAPGACQCCGGDTVFREREAK